MRFYSSYLFYSKRLLFPCIAVSIFQLFFFAESHALASESIYLITNKSNKDNRIINEQTFRAIYLMRTQSWPNGEKLTVFVLPDDEEKHAAFCKKFFGVLPYRLRKGWDRLIFSGKAGGAPVQVESIAEMKERVSKTPGAIGYVTEQYIDDSVAIVEVQ